MIDETTDIATHSQLSIYVRYLHQGASKTVFCSLVKVHNGKSDTIRAAVVQFLRDAELPLNKMCAFGSDGAAAMLGKKNGVAAQLQTMVPHILVNHCVAHRLALASSQAAEKVPYLLKWKAIVEQLFRFYHASGVRTASLLEIQTILEEPKVKVTEAKDVRWLSHNKAVKAIRRCLPSLLTSLEHEARERCDAEAQGLAIFMQQYRFVAALMMMSDVLPVLANLSLALQTKDAVYSTVGTLVMGAITTVRSMKEHPELNFRELPVTIGQLSGQPFRFKKPSANDVSDFKSNVFDKFIDAVVNNLESRFPHIPVLEAFSMFNPTTVPEDQAERNDHCKDELQMLVERFTAVLPDATEAASEYSVLKNTIHQDLGLQKTSTTVLMEKVAGPLKEAMPNLRLLAAVGLLLPTSTADCERGFSTLKRVKTAQRNRLQNEALNAVLRVSMEGPSVADFTKTEAEKMVSEWAREKRRLLV
ncbi:ZN862-like protein [Mya arenaria]|uniref:ZN862-like protein n=1 Tax=Mya arenaria TaxID=6604 RepID=A0ABY7GDW2_MYAAR|nr:zinc finger protein 862-like [Mya arenaria]WAR31542.1 ZN862-like protein [Mya arenaria]